MGSDSMYHRYRELGEDANVNNVDEYGEPVRSLFTSTKVFTLHHEINITDEYGKTVYESHSKFLSLRDKTEVTDAYGELVAYIERQLISLHNRHFVTMADGTEFQISSELFHLVRDVINIEELGWQIQGNILGLNFQLYDAEGEIVAVISQKMFSIHDKYCIDIYQPEYEKIVVAILVTLQHIMVDRESTSAGGGASSGND